MLSIRNAEPADFEALSRFMVREGLLNENDTFDGTTRETMLLIDEEMILGYASAELIDYKPQITEIYIPEKLRGHLLGDAVLRGLLYYFLNRGFEKVYAPLETAFSGYLIHEGFVENGPLLEVDLEDFFNQKCRGCKDAH